MNICFENYLKLVMKWLFYKWICCLFSSFIKFWSSERKTENTTSDLYFNEETDYSKENTSENEDINSAILQLLQFEPALSFHYISG